MAYILENSFLKRSFIIENKVLRTKDIVNKRTEQTLVPLESNEFRILVSKGTDIDGAGITLDSNDFIFKHASETDTSLSFQLHNSDYDLALTVNVSLSQEDFYLRKHLVLQAGRTIFIERIDVEFLGFEDACQPYTTKEITALSDRETMQPGWRPGLGQPLFTKTSGTFWGLEFPAADNHVEGNTLFCGYQCGRVLQANQGYQSYNSVMGCSDDARYISQVFYEYIDRIRARPLRLQTQYNSWFDYGSEVSCDTFSESVKKVNHELCEKRGVAPLKAYAIDDGWQDSGDDSDWSDHVWKVNEKFDKDFASSHAAVTTARSTLGLWVSPQCNFGAKGAVRGMRANKMGALTRWMSMANTPYMDKLETRLTELAEQGVSYFKLDGIFGHQFRREFDIDGADHGIPMMPHLETDGFSANDKRLNDTKYDELKIYYLTVGTERLIKIFAEMSRVNPGVYIVISNGAYLSPWWLMHCDAVWMINAGDAASGSNRTAELVYRDGIYYEICKKDHTQYPINSLFNHEPKKTKSGESADTFRKYLYMNMSRGTGFVELYLKTFALSQADWDVLAEGLHWLEHVFPTFTRACMHGGDPREHEVYGYSAWNDSQGYVSCHNPGNKEQTYELALNRDIGLLPCKTDFYTSSPIAGSLDGLKTTYTFGNMISMTLTPGEIRIINFDVKKADWTKRASIASDSGTGQDLNV